MKILDYILTFFLVCLLLGNTVLFVINNKILNKEYAIQVLEENKFYDAVLLEVNDGFENFIYQSGLPKDTIESLATIDIVKRDINSMVNYIYGGNEFVLSSDTIRLELDTRISEFIVSEKRNLSKEERENITKFEDLIVSSYEESIMPVKNYFGTINEYYIKVCDILKNINFILVIVIIVFILIFIVLNKNTKINLANGFGIAFLSSGILFKMFENVIFKYIDVDNLLVFSSSLTNLVQFVIKKILYGFGELGTLYIVFGISLILFYSIIKALGEKER